MVLLFAAHNAMGIPATFVAQYEERAGIILLSKVFAIYNVVALLVLVPIAGVYGAVIASGSAQVFKTLFIWWHVRHRARWLQGGLAFASALVLWGSGAGGLLRAQDIGTSPGVGALDAGCGDLRRGSSSSSSKPGYFRVRSGFARVGAQGQGEPHSSHDRTVEAELRKRLQHVTRRQLTDRWTRAPTL